MILVLKKQDKNLKIKDLDDLANIANERKQKIGIQRDAFYSEDFNIKMKEEEFSRNFESVPSSETNYRKLSYNRLLGFFDEVLTATDQIRKNAEYKDFAIHKFKISSEPVYFGISKKLDKRKYQKLQNAYLQLEKSGQLKKIRDRYYKL